MFILPNKKGSRSCLLLRRSAKLHAVLLAELLNATSGIDNFLLASIERVALRAHFDVQGTAVGGTRLEHVTAAARDVDLFVIRVGIGLHALRSLRVSRKTRNYQ